jgi:hypothetical protein
MWLACGITQSDGIGWKRMRKSFYRLGSWCEFCRWCLHNLHCTEQLEKLFELYTKMTAKSAATDKAKPARKVAKFLDTNLLANKNQLG